MADNQISVTVSADVAPLQSALQQASSAFQSAAGVIASTASEIANNAKQAFDGMAAAARQTSQALLQASQQTAQQEIQAAQQASQQLGQSLDRQLAEHRNYAENVRNLHRAAAGDVAKIWDQAGSQIEHTLMASFNRMIVSGGNFRQQMQRIAAQVQTALLTAIEKTVLSWITGENAKTAATVAGTAARSAAEEAAGSAGLASMALKAIKAIVNDASQTFAGIFAFLAPEMGPAAAGPAAAGEAMVMAAAGEIVSAAGGAWSLPGDMLVFAHQGESILPAHIADPMRDFFTSAAAGGRADGAAGGDVNFHVYAMDSRDVMNFFKRNGATLARVLKGEQRNFNASLASALR